MMYNILKEMVFDYSLYPIGHWRMSSMIVYCNTQVLLESYMKIEIHSKNCRATAILKNNIKETTIRIFENTLKNIHQMPNES